MTKYHLSKNGEPNLCQAKNKCPLTSMHFDTVADAQSYYETAMTENLNVPRTVSSDNNDYTEYVSDSKEFYESISDKEKAFLEKYVNQDYIEINEKLWAGEKIEEVESINKLLSKRSEIRTLWRKPPDSHEGLSDVRAGDVISLKGLTSASADSNAMLPLMETETDKYLKEVPADEWETDGLFKVKVPEEYKEKEPNVVFQFVTDMGKPVSELSHMPQEREFLLPSDTKWKVVAIKEQRTFSSSQSPLDDSESSEPKQRRALVYQLLEVD